MNFETVFSGYNQGGLSKMYRPNLSTLTVSGRDGELGFFASPYLGQTSGTSELADNIAQKWLVSFHKRSHEESFSHQLKRVISIQIKPTPNPSIRLAQRRVGNEFLQLENQLKAALESAPLEDGYSHAAEILLEKAIRNYGDRAGDWLVGVLSNQDQNDIFKAELLRLLSRLKPFTSTWRVDIIKLGLSSSSLEIRDAAVQSAESWEEAEAIQLLEAHKEPCNWLADYTSRVIRDLTTQ